MHHDVSSESLLVIFAQGLLNHPFLRPTAAPVAATPDCLVGLTVDQLKKVLAQVRTSPLHSIYWWMNPAPHAIVNCGTQVPGQKSSLGAAPSWESVPRHAALMTEIFLQSSFL